MLNERMFEKKELSEFSRQVYGKLVPADHFFYRVNKLVDFSFVNDLCKGLYSKDMGRPAYPQSKFSEEQLPSSILTCQTGKWSRR